MDQLQNKQKVSNDIKRVVPPHMSVSTKPKIKPIIRNTEIENWQVGDTAIHAKWGNGTIIDVVGNGAAMKLKIEFPTMGIRMVMAKFAPVKKG